MAGDGSSHRHVHRMAGLGTGRAAGLLAVALATCLVCLVALPATGGEPAAAAGSVELTVTERLGIDRRGEPVTMGIPFPEGVLKDVGNLRLTRAGKEVPAQFRATGLWHPKDSVRWVLVDFQTDVKAGEKQPYVLEYGPNVKREAAPASPVSIKEDADAYTVDTGAATFRISRKVFSLFEEVKLADGTVLVAAPAAGAPRYGAEIKGLKACVTRPVPGAENKGKAHFIYAKNTGCKEPEDFTLKFTSNSAYELTDGKGGAAGKGSQGADFTSADGKIAIPKDGWRVGARAAAGDTFTFRAIPEGSSAASEAVTESAAIESGPMRSVLRVKGSFGPASAAAMEFTAWYHFYAGSSRVKLAFTLENNRHGAMDGTGNAAHGPLSDIGGTNCVFFDDMSLSLPLALGEAPTASILGDADSKPVVAAVKARTELYQDSGGGDKWDRYKQDKYRPRPNSYVSFKGYRILAGEEKLAEGARAVGWLDLADGAKGLTLSVCDFWQNCPKGLAAGPDGRAEVGLFPGRYAGDFPLRTGEHKTHEILFLFHKGAAAAAGGPSAARGFSDPLRAEPTPAWFARTKALGELHPFDLENYRGYETLNLSFVGQTPEGKPSRTSVVKQIENFNFYGWMDYGDVPLDFEGGTGQWGMKYDLDYHMAQQYARTLNPEWWRFFTAADRHVRDIDIHHQPRSPNHWMRGGSWAHSQHNEAGHKNPHRNYGRFTQDLCFGGRGTATLYYLTGDWKAREACLELADNALEQYMSPQKDPGEQKDNNRLGSRGTAGTLERLLEGYQLTGEGKYLDRARWQIKACAYDGKPPAQKDASLWSSLFYMMALARYVELFPDDAAARGYLLAHLDTLLKGTTPEKGIYYTVKVAPDGTVTGKGDCGMYDLMAADALAIGYRLTGEAKYLDMARKCFAYGVRCCAWNNKPEVYCHIKEGNGGTHGNIFMVADTQARAGGK